MGPFKLQISNTVEPLDFSHITGGEKEVLCSGISFNPAQHDIYRLLVAPKFLSSIKESRRKTKKMSYSKADRILINLQPGSNAIRLLGIYPETLKADGQSSFDFDGEAILEFGIPKLFCLKVKGAVKNKIRKDVYKIFASRTDEFAQWVFLKSYISSESNIRLQILCLAPKNLEEKFRYIICDAKVADKGRTLDEIRGKKISIP